MMMALIVSRGLSKETVASEKIPISLKIKLIVAVDKENCERHGVNKWHIRFLRGWDYCKSWFVLHIIT